VLADLSVGVGRDGLAHGEAGDLPTDRHHLAGEFVAGDDATSEQLQLRSMEVAAADAAEVRADEDLGRSRRGIGHGDQFVSALVVEDDGFHRWFSCRWGASPTGCAAATGKC